MRSLSLLFLLGWCLILTAGAFAQDDNVPDTLVIQRLEAEKGGQVSLKVDFFSDQELAALTIPLTVVGDEYLIDSVSFAGSRIEYLQIRPVTVKENRKQVVFGAICMTEDYIPAGRGLMATLYLSPSGSGKGELTVIDTTTIGPASLLFTKPSSASFLPKLSTGAVILKKAADASSKKDKGDKEATTDDAGGKKKN